MEIGCGQQPEFHVILDGWYAHKICSSTLPNWHIFVWLFHKHVCWSWKSEWGWIRVFVNWQNCSMTNSEQIQVAHNRYFDSSTIKMHPLRRSTPSTRRLHICMCCYMHTSYPNRKGASLDSSCYFLENIALYAHITRAPHRCSHRGQLHWQFYSSEQDPLQDKVESVELVLQQPRMYGDDCRVGTPVKWIFIFNFAKEEEAQKKAIVLQ